MFEDAIKIEYMPEMSDPLLIAGFDGWGNALDISTGLVDYMVRNLDARPFAELDPDTFYRFDENRPLVHIENGILKQIFPPGGQFYFAERDRAGRDLILFKATEPNLRWFQFAEAMIGICRKAGVKIMFCIGSMYDNVLHTDTIISASASNEELLASLKERKIIAVDYKGPGAIHSTVHFEAKKRGIESASLWCHCPYYLQGATHYGLLSHLGSLLASWGGFVLDTEELDTAWTDLSKQIQEIIDKNPELQGMINDLRRAKVKGSWDTARRHDKIIHLKDFLEPH